MQNKPLYKVRKIKDLRDMLDQSTALYSSDTAFLVKDNRSMAGRNGYYPVTFSAYRDDVNSLGTAFSSANALSLQGSKIAIISENRYEWAVTYLAIVNGTGIVVPMDKELPRNEILNLLKRSGANAIVFSASKRDDIANIKGQLPGIRYYIDMDNLENNDWSFSYSKLLGSGRELLRANDTSFTEVPIDAESMSILLFTSGTTDKSKAVMLSHGNICANLEAMCSMSYIDEKDTFLSVLPLHHTYECTCGFLCPLYRGAAIAHCEGLRHIAKNLAESKATILLAVPAMIEAMYKKIWTQAEKTPKLLKKLKTGLVISNLLRKIGIDKRRKIFSKIIDNFGGELRFIISGGAAIDPNVMKGIQDFGIHCVQGYGLTESAPIIALNRDVYFKDASAGLPLPGVSIEIDNPSQDGTGEIIAKGPNIMLGYYENEEATAEALKDGWFRTGDFGYIDEEGFVYITGRKKNVIVAKNGKNIFPEEIEILLGRSPYIIESMVYGKIAGDDGVEVAASIYPDFEKLAEDNGGVIPDKDAIYKIIESEVKKLNKELVLYKYIRHIDIRTEEFKKNTSRKIIRHLNQNETIGGKNER